MRHGLHSRQDVLNSIADICTDPTLDTFPDAFDPISYAPRQHGPLLTIIGTHDQSFRLPAINSTYERVASADTNPRFIKRFLVTANGKHGVIDSDDLLPTRRAVIKTILNWFNYSFRSGSTPPPTPTVRMEVIDGTMWFRGTVLPGNRIHHVDLYFATQLDTVQRPACDFAVSRLAPQSDEYSGAVPIRTALSCGLPATPENILSVHVRPGWCGLHREFEDALPVCGDGLWHRFRTTLRAFSEGQFPLSADGAV
jgi:hypothetical protein